jgi:hypothetical protein
MGKVRVIASVRLGTCRPIYRGAVQITNGVVQAAGGNYGRVSPDGSVSLAGSLGENHGAASGRLSRNTGRGTWQAHIQNKDCSGVWSAQRQ